MVNSNGQFAFHCLHRRLKVVSPTVFGFTSLVRSFSRDVAWSTEAVLLCGCCPMNGLKIRLAKIDGLGCVQGRSQQNLWRGKEVIFADKKGVSHSLKVWSTDKYSNMLLLCVSVSNFILKCRTLKV